ncbi:tetratricopeptide repeat protein [Salinimicrobium sp. GXAS 041]|uniref:tetratricopeptide repeat protein n=1 Tax=Salinimicrobium sp. GXAS 041 TaxID=3400806 RepID=UPI003C788DC4
MELAKNYFEQGQYEKSLSSYEKLYAENPHNATYFMGVISSHQQLENFSDAEKLLLERLNNTANAPGLLVELGHNYELQEQDEKAARYYEEAINAIESRPNYAFSIAQSFERYSLLEMAIKAYEKGMSLNPDTNYNIQLARLYGEQGEVEKMFSNYIDLVGTNPAFLPTVRRMYGQFLTEDPNNEANLLFRKLLLKKLRENPDTLYNEMLSGLFMQQKEFKKAFLQEKAIYLRSGGEQIGRIIQLAFMAKEEDPEAAVEILDFLIEKGPSEELRLQAHQMKLSVLQQESKFQGYDAIEAAYLELFKKYGKGLQTLELQLDFARFLAFKRDEPQQGAEVLNALLEQNLGKFREAAVKMTLADILVLDEMFNQALIYYSQVQKLVENDVMAQNARYKVAQTSYYKGDFKWATTQLDVLKSSTSQLIANDAMELSLLISDNSGEDSLQTALKLFAKADLLAFQNKNQEAIEMLEEILQNHKAEEIEDEALLKQAQLFEETGNLLEAEENYLKIIRLHKNGILGDNAHYRLAELYANDLNEPEKAKEFYEKIVFNYADSIYFVESRRKFRALRGDAVE